MIHSSKPRRSVRPLPRDDAHAGLQLTRRPDEGEHHVQVVVASVVHALHRLELEPEQVGLAHVPEGAPIADHRVGLRGLVLLSARQTAELVRPEVDRAVRDRAGSEPGRECHQAVRHALDELIRPALLEQATWMRALERFEDHQLRAQEADAVDVKRGGVLHLRRLGEVHEQARGGHGRRGGARACRKPAPLAAGSAVRPAVITPSAGIDGDLLAVAQPSGRVTRANHARNSQLPRDDRRVAGHSARVGHDSGGTTHQRHPVRRRHVGHENLAALERRRVRELRHQAHAPGGAPGRCPEAAQQEFARLTGPAASWARTSRDATGGCTRVHPRRKPIRCPGASRSAPRFGFRAPRAGAPPRPRVSAHPPRPPSAGRVTVP